MEFQGNSDLAGFISFLQEQKVLEKEGSKEAWDDGPAFTPGYVATLNIRNIGLTIADPTRHTFVKFYAPWSKRCTSISSVWVQLAQELKLREDIVIAEIDCAAHPSIPKEYQIKGFPTLRLFVKGPSDGGTDSPQGKDYGGPSDVQALTKFLLQSLGG